MSPVSLAGSEVADSSSVSGPARITRLVSEDHGGHARITRLGSDNHSTQGVDMEDALTSALVSTPSHGVELIFECLCM